MHPINAGADSVHYKPSFGTAFRFRRCLVPANGWFRVATDPAWQAAVFPGARGRGSCYRSPRCGSIGKRAENPWSPSPSSPRWPPRRLPTSTIDSRRSSKPTGLRIGLIQCRRSRGSSSWCVNPVPVPTRRRAVSTRVNSVQNDDPGIPAPVSEERLM